MSNYAKLALFFLFSQIAAAAAFFLAAQKIPWLAGANIVSERKWLYIIVFFSSLAVGGLAFLFQKKIDLYAFIKQVTVFLFPAAAVLAVAFSYSHEFHPFAFLLVNFCVFSSFVLFFRQYLTKSHSDKKLNLSLLRIKELIKNNKIQLAVLSLAVIIYLFFGILRLGKFAAVDEPLWTFDRIPKYWNNVADGEFHKTMISDKPGITVALVSGVGLLAVNPKEYKLIRHETHLEQSGKKIEKLNLSFRLPFLIFGAFGIFLFYFLLKNLLGKEAALFSSIFIALSPIILGVSRIVNPDGLLWIFLPATFLSFLLYLRHNNSLFYVILTGILLGLSLLTKYVSNILLFIFPLFIFLDYALRDKNSAEKNGSYFKKSFLDFIAIVIISLFVFYALLPATWMRPARVLEATFFSDAFINFWHIFVLLTIFLAADTLIWKNYFLVKMADFIRQAKKIILVSVPLIFIFFVIFAFLNVRLDMRWYDFESIMASPKTSAGLGFFLGSFSSNFYSLVFGLVPLALFGGMLALIWYFRNKNEIEKRHIFYFSLFILIYYFASVANEVSATVRYQIVAFPVFMIMAGIGLKNFREISRTGTSFSVILCFLTIVAGIWSFHFIRPFYFSYASSLLPQKYVLNYKDMGDGSYEAAEFLNSLPEADDKILWTDKRGVCYFFTGKCLNDYNLKEGQRIDYFAVSAGRKNRTEKLILTKGRENTYDLSLNELYERQDYIKIIEIGGRPGNYIKIFFARNLNSALPKDNH